MFMPEHSRHTDPRIYNAGTLIAGLRGDNLQEQMPPEEQRARRASGAAVEVGDEVCH